MTLNWKREIAVAYLVKQRVMQADVRDLWPYHLPEIAAKEEQITAAERILGHHLDPQFREFLKHANGWKAFHHAIDLFGTEDLVGGPRNALAHEILVGLEDLRELCGFSSDELLPIAVSQVGIDVFVMTRPQTQSPGLVIWLAGQVIQRFPDFVEYFLAMVDYSRLDVERLEKLK